MNREDLRRPRIPRRLIAVGRQARTPLAAVCLGVLALGLFVALESAQPSEAEAAPAGIGSPALTSGLPGSVAAQEEPMELHCPGTALLNFEPGVGPTPEHQKVTGEMRGGTDMDPKTPCTSPTGVPYQGGTAELEGAGEIGCAAAGAVMDIAGTAEIFWDNGDTSKAVWSVVSYGAAPVVDVRITEGALAPAQVYQQGTPTGFNGNCTETSPMTSASFTGVAHVIADDEAADTAAVPEAEVPEATGAAGDDG